MGYDYQIKVEFGTAPVDFGEVRSVMEISSARDEFKLSHIGLLISYSRSKRQSGKPYREDQQEETSGYAFNHARREHLKRLWMLYYGLSGKIPNISRVKFGPEGRLDEVDRYKAGVPTELKVEDWPDIIPVDEPFLDSHEAESLWASSHRDAALTAMTYLYASRRVSSYIMSVNMVSRFRYLWSAFNALYNEYNVFLTGKEKPSGPEINRAIDLVNAMNDGCELDNLKDGFREDSSMEIDQSAWRWSRFLTQYSLFRMNAEKTGFRRKTEQVAGAFGECDRELLEYYANPHKCWPAKRWESFEENPIEDLLRSGDDGRGDRFKFIMTRYLYWRRCDSIHADCPCPVFLDGDESRLLDDLSGYLEELVKRGIKYLAALPLPPNRV